MRQRQPAADRKAQIVAEVLRLADESGPDRLTTSDVARAVGISQPAIFRHFPSKGAMWVAVSDAVAERFAAEWDHAEAAASEPSARLRGLIATQLTILSETPALPHLLFSRELQADNPDLRNAFGQLLASFHARLIAAIRPLQAGGRLRADLAPEDVAVLLTSLVQGVAIRWSLGARSWPLVPEGLRLFDLQLSLLGAKPGGAGAF